MIVSTKQDTLKNLFKVCAAINLIMSLTKGTIHIGGAAPSVYSKKILREAEIDDNEFRQRIESNLIDYDKFMADDFDGYFIDRAKKIIKIRLFGYNRGYEFPKMSVSTMKTAPLISG